MLPREAREPREASELSDASWNECRLPAHSHSPYRFHTASANQHAHSMWQRQLSKLGWRDAPLCQGKLAETARVQQDWQHGLGRLTAQAEAVCQAGLCARRFKPRQRLLLPQVEHQVQVVRPPTGSCSVHCTGGHQEGRHALQTVQNHLQAR